MKFIVFSMYRAGSSMLVSAINGHTPGLCLGEIFGTEGKSGPRGIELATNHRTDGGMTIKYKHYEVHEWIRNNIKDWKVIHIYREDVLAHALSVYRFHNRLGPNHSISEVNALKIEPKSDIIKAWMNYIEERLQFFRKELQNSGCQVLDISYEEITNGINIQEFPEKQSYKICDFLEIGKKILRTGYHKTVPDKLSDHIINIDKIKKEINETT